MKTQEVGLVYNGKRVNLTLKVCNAFERFSGLMFTRRKNAKALLFDFKKPVRIAIHSFFVFFPFLAIWVDADGKIIELKAVRKFRPYILPKKAFCKLIEIPVNEKYRKVTKLLVGN